MRNRPRVTKKIPYTNRVKLKTTSIVSTSIPATDPDEVLEELTETIVGYLEEGCPVEVVCGLAGISLLTYGSWVKRGEVYESLMYSGKQRKEDEKYYTFVLEVRRAGAIWMRERIVRLGERATPYWQKDITLLERRDRINWGKDNREARPEDYDPDDTFL